LAKISPNLFSANIYDHFREVLHIRWKSSRLYFGGSVLEKRSCYRSIIMTDNLIYSPDHKARTEWGADPLQESIGDPPTLRNVFLCREEEAKRGVNLRKIKDISRFSLLFFLIVMLVPFGYACGGKGSANTILSISEGEVLIMKSGAGAWVNGEVKMELKASDLVKSGTGSSVVITFFDGSTLELKPETQIEIVELASKTSRVIRLKQQLGETISTVQKMADPASRYEIETPAAIAGVRGSSMLVKVAADGTTQVQNLEGNIYVSAVGVELAIPVGNSSTVKPGQPPSAPVIIPLPSATDDFSTTNGNPNGNWSYGWMPIDFSTFNLYTTHNSYQWYGPLGGDLTPCIWKNTGGLSYGVPAGWLSLHPGPGHEPSVLRWTGLSAGDICISGQFLAGDGGIMTVSVRHNNKEVWTASDSGDFDLTANIMVGDTIDFAVYGGYGYGNTPISATISYIK
jgi:hypothetical protein